MCVFCFLLSECYAFDGGNDCCHVVCEFLACHVFSQDDENRVIAGNGSCHGGKFMVVDVRCKTSGIARAGVYDGKVARKHDGLNVYFAFSLF